MCCAFVGDETSSKCTKNLVGAKGLPRRSGLSWSSKYISSTWMHQWLNLFHGTARPAAEFNGRYHIMMSSFSPPVQVSALGLVTWGRDLKCLEGFCLVHGSPFKLAFPVLEAKAAVVDSFDAFSEAHFLCQ